MNFTKVEKRIIEDKPNKYNLIKTNNEYSNIKVITNRILFLQNNYSINSSDNILYLSKSLKKMCGIQEEYNKLYVENKYKYFSLLASEKEPQFKLMQNFLGEFSSSEKISTIAQKKQIILDILKQGNLKSKNKLHADNVFQIINEIKFMKNNWISTYDDYKDILNSQLRLRRNSKTRLEMFYIFENYNLALKDLKLIDEEDLITKIKNTLPKNDPKYHFTHIFIDNAEEFSQLEIDLLLNLLQKTDYSSLYLLINVNRNENIFSSLIKKGKVYPKKVFTTKYKNYNLIQKKSNHSKFANTNTSNFLSNYTYIDLINKRNIEFKKDTSNVDEIIFNDQILHNDNELDRLPIYNEIAAGEPILIVPDQSDYFELPKNVIRRIDNKFVLTVKGDSMINAGINNGNLVIIEKTQGINSGDIVAANIDGEATLKRILIKDNCILLKPENDNYKSIQVSEYSDFTIIGKAIGLIKKS